MSILLVSLLFGLCACGNGNGAAAGGQDSGVVDGIADGCELDQDIAAVSSSRSIMRLTDSRCPMALARRFMTALFSSWLCT